MTEEWSLKIIRTDNGYLLKGSDGQKSVIQEKEDDDLYEHEYLLFEVQDYFNFQGTKYDKERIKIVRETGSDYIGQ